MKETEAEWEKEGERETDDRVELWVVSYSSCTSLSPSFSRSRFLSLRPLSLSLLFAILVSLVPWNRPEKRDEQTKRENAFCSGSSTVLPRTHRRSSRSHLSSLLHALARALVRGSYVVRASVCVCVPAICGHPVSSGDEERRPIDFHRVSKFSMHIPGEELTPRRHTLPPLAPPPCLPSSLSSSISPSLFPSCLRFASPRVVW